MSRLSRSIGGLVGARYGGWRGLLRVAWLPVVVVGALGWSFVGIVIRDFQYRYLSSRVTALEMGQGTMHSAVAAIGIPRSAFDPSAALLPPSVQAEVTRHYGWALDATSGVWSFRKDVQFALPPEGGTVVADQPGEVTAVTVSPDGTVGVTLQHAKGFVSDYSLLERAAVDVGDQVRAGHLLGRGHTLSLRLTRGGQVVNPETGVVWAPKLKEQRAF